MKKTQTTIKTKKPKRRFFGFLYAVRYINIVFVGIAGLLTAYIAFTDIDETYSFTTIEDNKTAGIFLNESTKNSWIFNTTSDVLTAYASPARMVWIPRSFPFLNKTAYLSLSTNDFKGDIALEFECELCHTTIPQIQLTKATLEDYPESTVMGEYSVFSQTSLGTNQRGVSVLQWLANNVQQYTTVDIASVTFDMTRLLSQDVERTNTESSILDDGFTGDQDFFFSMNGITERVELEVTYDELSSAAGTGKMDISIIDMAGEIVDSITIEDDDEFEDSVKEHHKEYVELRIPDAAATYRLRIQTHKNLVYVKRLKSNISSIIYDEGVYIAGREELFTVVTSNSRELHITPETRSAQQTIVIENVATSEKQYVPIGLHQIGETQVVDLSQGEYVIRTAGKITIEGVYLSADASSYFEPFRLYITKHSQPQFVIMRALRERNSDGNSYTVPVYLSPLIKTARPDYIKWNIVSDVLTDSKKDSIVPLHRLGLKQFNSIGGNTVVSDTEITALSLSDLAPTSRKSLYIPKNDIIDLYEFEEEVTTSDTVTTIPYTLIGSNELYINTTTDEFALNANVQVLNNTRGHDGINIVLYDLNYNPICEEFLTTSDDVSASGEVRTYPISFECTSEAGWYILAIEGGGSDTYMVDTVLTANNIQSKQLLTFTDSTAPVYVDGTIDNKIEIRIPGDTGELSYFFNGNSYSYNHDEHDRWITVELEEGINTFQFNSSDTISIRSAQLLSESSSVSPFGFQIVDDIDDSVGMAIFNTNKHRLDVYEISITD